MIAVVEGKVPERGSEKLAKEEREREGDAWTKSGSDGAAQWNGSTPAADANGRPTHWRYLGYSQCVCAGLTFLFIEQSRLSLSPSFRFLFSHPLLSTSPSFHASFLPHSTDGFTRTLSLFLPPFLSFSHPLFEFYLFFNFPFSQMNFPNCCLRLLKLVSIFIEIVSNGTSDITDIFLEDIHNFINHLV